MSTTDFITLLKCEDSGAIATKRICLHSDGSIEKKSFSAGKNFTVRQVAVSDIWSLGEAIGRQEDQFDEVLIRGELLPDQPKVVLRRKEGSEGGAFREKARRWIMLDIDDFPLPDWIDPAGSPEDAVKWVRASLPGPFRKATCYYQFSSGQNLPKKEGDPPPKIAKLHLFFWLNRPMSSQQIRDYINEKT